MVEIENKEKIGKRRKKRRKKKKTVKNSKKRVEEKRETKMNTVDEHSVIYSSYQSLICTFQLDL